LFLSDFTFYDVMFFSVMKICTLEDLWDDERKKAQIHWTFLFSNLIAQWAQWLGMFTIDLACYKFMLDNINNN